MSRRLEIEITSINGDVATWRAAGAKLPKGVLNVSLVPGDARVGVVYRADVEQYMEGMDVVSVVSAGTVVSAASVVPVATARLAAIDRDPTDRLARSVRVAPTGPVPDRARSVRPVLP